jgi:diguanylate cyclase (GGDEF)-like protein/PAS domain S-box-containing protein
MNKKNNSLRAAAEKQLQHASTTNSEARSAEELLYELQVHQIELEMQNENLRQSYEALAESQQDYFDLYEFAPIGYLTLSQQGLIEKINLTGATLLGKSRSQLLQRRFAGFINAIDATRWHLFFAQVMRGNQQKTLEVSLKQPNDNWLHAQLHCLPVLKTNKQLTLWIALTDITAIKQAAERVITANIELALQNEEKEKRATELVIANKEILTAKNQLQIIIDLMPIAVFAKDSQHRIILMNKACEKKWGLSFNQVKNTTGSQFFPTEQMADFLAVDKQAFTDDKLHETEGFIWNSQLQANRIHHSYKQAVFDESGQPLYLIGVSDDITERKRLEKQLTESERHLRAILDTTPDCVKLVARDGTLLSINAAGLALIDADSEDEVRNQCVYSLLAPEYRDAFQAFNEAVCDGKSGKMEFEIIGLNGTRHWMETRAVPFNVENGDCIQLAFSNEITERKRLEKSIHDSESKFRALFNSSTDAIMLYDSMMLDCNQAALTLFGCKTVAEFCTYHPADLSPLEQPCGTNSLILGQQYIATALEKGQLRFEWTHKKIDTGESFLTEVLLTALILNEKSVLQATVHDISERKAAEEEIRQLAFYDPLTGLPNRRKLLARLHYSIAINRRNNSQFAVFMMDLDKFKAVNDKLGHAAGDELLKQVAARIRNCLRESDMVARLGGDEFVLILENLKIPEMAEIIALKVIASLTLPFQLSETNSVQIGASIGISLYPQDGNTAESLMDHADTALYQAKDNGRGCFAYFSGNGLTLL